MDINEVITYLKNYDGKPLTFMEVCGTHTASISENAIETLISPKIKLISGPGCPVCVTVSSYIDKLCNLALKENNVIVSFGDMIRVKGSKMALKDAKALGGDVRMVYSPIEIIDMAKNEPDKNFIFAAVGFETTTPIYALLIDNIYENNINNIKILTAIKTMPPIIEYLCNTQSNIDGFIAPGHVAVITGANAFEPLAKLSNLPFVVSGFEDKEILATIYALVKLQGNGVVKNLYKKVVNDCPNEKAQQIVNKYFEKCDSSWRGIGIVKNSGLCLKDEYKKYDAGSSNLLTDEGANNGCHCGKIIIGKEKPTQCPLYKTICNPENPQGACMVSMEGTCFNYYVNNRG